MTGLLDPVALGPRTARNRIVFGPHETNLARRRAVSDRHVAYYRRRAAGGAGTIVVEEASVHPSDWPYERCPLAADSLPGWAAVASACHAEGALVLAALGHAGGQGSSAYSQRPLWAPSRVPEVTSREVPKAMEEDDIAAVLDGFTAAAALAAEAGLDGVELNAGQFSLLRQFLSGLTNHRDDAWGDDRARLVRLALDGVRRAAPGLVVGLRLSCDELAPWAGIVPEEGARLATELAPLVDVLTVVRGSIFTASATRPDTHEPEGFNRGLCHSVRQAVGGAVPVVAQGSIVAPARAEELVAAGTADLVEMTRAQIADAALVAKVGRGEAHRVRPCIRCNQWCQARDARNPLVSCVADPASGHEWDEPALLLGEGGVPAAGSASDGAGGGPSDRVGAGASRRAGDGDGDGDQAEPGARLGRDRGPVLVVGAGPAGLECARVAATLGRRVVVVEQRDASGGSVAVAAAAEGRAPLAQLTDWLTAECERLGVELRTGTVADADLVQAHDGPVVVCTGSLPGRRPYDVADDARDFVVPAGELLARWARTPGDTSAGQADGARSPLGSGAVAVWDPIGGPVGVSVAEHLARRWDGAISLVTPDLVVGQELARPGDLAPANARLQQAGVELVRRSVLRRVEAGAVVLEDRFSGETTRRAAALVVDAGHRLPDDGLWEELVVSPGAASRHWKRAGDAVAPRGIGDAVLEGRRAALALTQAPAPPGPSVRTTGVPG